VARLVEEVVNRVHVQRLDAAHDRPAHGQRARVFGGQPLDRAHLRREGRASRQQRLVGLGGGQDDAVTRRRQQIGQEVGQRVALLPGAEGVRALQHQQQAPPRQRRQHVVARRQRRQPGDPGQQRLDFVGSCGRAAAQPDHTIAEAPAKAVGELRRQPTLAYAIRPGQQHQTAIKAEHVFGQLAQQFAPPDESKRHRQVVGTRHPVGDQRAGSALNRLWQGQPHLVTGVVNDQLVAIRLSVGAVAQIGHRRAECLAHTCAAGQLRVEARVEGDRLLFRRPAACADYRLDWRLVEQHLRQPPAEAPIQDDDARPTGRKQPDGVLGHRVGFATIVVFQDEHVALAVRDDVDDAKSVRAMAGQGRRQPLGGRRQQAHQRQRHARRLLLRPGLSKRA